jgi:elongation factor 1-gamma
VHAVLRAANPAPRRSRPHPAPPPPPPSTRPQLTPAFVLGKDNLTPAFKAASPMGRVPLLETPEGAVFESNAIARYVARIRRDTELTGRTFFETAEVDAWMDFSTTEVELPAGLLAHAALGLAERRADAEAAAAAGVAKALAVLDRHLASRTFLVGEAVTLADITLACALLYPLKFVLDGAARAPFPHATRWFVTCVNQPAFKAVLGETVLCEEGGAAGAAAAAAAPKAAAPKAEKAPKAPKAAAAPAPAAAAGGDAPKADKKKKKKDDDDDDDGDDDMAAMLAAEPKKVDPFAALPPSPLNLDEWKRTYSNSKADFYAVMPWFWEHLDSAGWTVWKQEYKYNAENKVDWQTSNLIGGFLQRCDEVRKYAFGGMAVLGAEAPFVVQGVWLLRGKSIKPMEDCNPDAEYYQWTAVDPTNAADRKLTEDTWCSMTTLDGKPIYDSKVRRANLHRVRARRRARL